MTEETDKVEPTGPEEGAGSKRVRFSGDPSKSDKEIYEAIMAMASDPTETE